MRANAGMEQELDSLRKAADKRTETCSHSTFFLFALFSLYPISL